MSATTSWLTDVGHEATVDTADARRPLRLRPHARRRNRIAAGVALGGLAIAGNVWAYSSIDDAEPVVQAVRDIPAGEVITADQLRVVDVEVDQSVNAVPADRLDSLVGSYAKVRIVSGSLVVDQALQATPLVGAGNAVVAVVIPPAELPVGLRERAPVQVVLPARNDDDETRTFDARTVGLPVSVDSALGERSVSLEVDLADAALVAAADDVRLVLVEPRVDTAADQPLDAGVSVDAGATATDTGTTGEGDG